MECVQEIFSRASLLFVALCNHLSQRSIARKTPNMKVLQRFENCETLRKGYLEYKILPRKIFDHQSVWVLLYLSAANAWRARRAQWHDTSKRTASNALNLRLIGVRLMLLMMGVISPMNHGYRPHNTINVYKTYMAIRLLVSAQYAYWVLSCVRQLKTNSGKYHIVCLAPCRTAGHLHLLQVYLPQF